MTWKYFNIKEFACQHCGRNHIQNSLVDELDTLRSYFGKPIIIESGYRCIEYDQSIGGKGNHPTGNAVDIRCDNSRDRYILLQLILGVTSFNRIGIGSNFIHLDKLPNDMKPQDVCWLY